MRRRNASKPREVVIRLEAAIFRAVEAQARKYKVDVPVVAARLVKEGLRNVASWQVNKGNHPVTVQLDDADFAAVREFANERNIDLPAAVCLLVKRGLLTRKPLPHEEE